MIFGIYNDYISNKDKESTSISKHFEEYKDDLKSDGKVIEKLQKEGLEEIKNTLKNSKSSQDKALNASLYLFGAYNMNVVSRFEFCKKYDVDISKFVDAYKKENYAIYDKSKKIISTEFNKKKYEFSESSFIDTMQDETMKYVKQDMLEISQSWKMDYKNTCLVLSKNEKIIDKLVDYSNLQKTLPEAYTIVNQYN
jgi:hypothetical protein